MSSAENFTLSAKCEAKQQEYSELCKRIYWDFKINIYLLYRYKYCNFSIHKCFD